VFLYQEIFFIDFLFIRF